MYLSETVLWALIRPPAARAQLRGSEAFESLCDHRGRGLAMQPRGMLWLPEFGPINLNKGGFRVCVSGYRRPYTSSGCRAGRYRAQRPEEKNGTVGQRHNACSIARRPTALPGVEFESTEFVSTARSAFFTKYECLSFSPAHEAQSGTARSTPCCNRFPWIGGVAPT